MNEAVIAAYMNTLTPQLAVDSQAELDRIQTHQGLRFGTRPVCTVLRPRFVSLADYRWLGSRISVLMSAFAKAEAHALKNAEFRKMFALTGEEEELALLDPGFQSYPTSRLDAFWVSRDELRFTEYNSETPAGAAYNYALSSILLSLPCMDEFQRKYHVSPLATHQGVINSLLKAYAQWSKMKELPRIAILDWKEVPTYSEFLLYQGHFHARGIDAVIADPREVTYSGGKLRTADGKPIDMIYKRVLISELLERGGINHPVVQAVRKGDVCMINPFRCKILYKKASLAALSDENSQSLFSKDEQQAIAEHIPWTRMVTDRKATPLPVHKQSPRITQELAKKHQGSVIDLVPHIIANKDAYVLKPNDDYGGKGIFLGWTVTQQEWEAAVQTALKSPYIVQERVHLPKEPFPRVVDGQLHVGECMMDTAPFVSMGEHMEGTLCRISTVDLLNVTAGGGSTVPTFIAEPR